MRILKYLFAHVFLLTVLGIFCLGHAAYPTTEKTDEFSLFADLQQQITELKIQMSKVITDKTKFERNVKSLQTRFEKEIEKTQNFREGQSADKSEIQSLKAEMNSLATKMLVIEGVFNPNIWMITPFVDLSEIKNPLDILHRKIESLDRPSSGIDNNVFFGKSCDTLIPSERSQKKRTIYPNGQEDPGVEVLCDFETDNGNWTIIQKWASGPEEEFSRNWTDYENGFGSLDGNFWIGLKTIHALTKNRDQELRIDLLDFSGDHGFAKYSNFSISASLDFYRLTVGGYSGTAGDSLIFDNGSRFSTKDKDNDDHVDFNCAESLKRGWWYKYCSSSDTIGSYVDKETHKMSMCVMYRNHWKDSFRCLRQVEMKIRSRR